MAQTPSRHIPPLAWIIGALVVVVLAWTATHWKGTYHPPSGGPAVPESQSGGGNPQAPYIPGTPPPPAPNGAGPLNQPGVQTGPTPNGSAS